LIRTFKFGLSLLFLAVFLISMSGCQSPEKEMDIPHPSLNQGPFRPKTAPASESVRHQSHYTESISQLNKVTQGTPYVELPLAEIIKLTKDTESEREVYKYAADAWSHEFFWKSTAENGGGKPSGEVLESIENSFGSYEQFRSVFLEIVDRLEGSGWVWLVLENGVLKVLSTSNYDIPVETAKPLLVLDAWEHAYLAEFENNRHAYAEHFLDHLANWKFAEKNLTSL